jgi:hypothetical protein
MKLEFSLSNQLIYKSVPGLFGMGVRDIELFMLCRFTGGRFCVPALVILKFLRDAETFFRSGISRNS